MNCCLLLIILLCCSKKEGRSCASGRSFCQNHNGVRWSCDSRKDTCGCEEKVPSCPCEEVIPPCPPPPMPRTQFPYLDSEHCGCEGK